MDVKKHLNFRYINKKICNNFANKDDYGLSFSTFDIKTKLAQSFTKCERSTFFEPQQK
jgi:hypothetical protein